MASREGGACSSYETDAQGRRRGWIGREDERLVRARAFGQRSRPPTHPGAGAWRGARPT
jgi:hypothetical protein